MMYEDDKKFVDLLARNVLLGQELALAAKKIVVGTIAVRRPN
jgi:hypothetical protein